MCIVVSCYTVWLSILVELLMVVHERVVILYLSVLFALPVMAQNEEDESHYRELVLKWREFYEGEAKDYGPEN